MHVPTTAHIKAVDRILRYIKRSPEKGLIYKKHDHLTLEGYTDADWTRSVDDGYSTTSYCVFLGENLLAWRSKKQSTGARSSVEAEYRTMTHRVAKLLWT